MSYSDLPLFDAICNSITTVLLLAGYIAIKFGNRDLHRKLMIAALTTSTFFLIGYLTHKFTMGPTHFTAQGPIRPIYFTMLISHTILAIVNLPLIIWAVVQAAKGNFVQHKKITRWAYPIWMYVSVTGVLVYLFLYQWFA